jgi:hypothetical protein
MTCIVMPMPAPSRNMPTPMNHLLESGASRESIPMPAAATGRPTRGHHL